MIRTNNDKGFTLIEITTIIAVLAILGLFTFSFVDDAITVYTVGNKQRMIYQEGSYIMERLTREMRDMTSLANCNYQTFDNSFSFTKRHRTLEGIDNLTVTYRRDIGTDIMYRDGNTSPSPRIGSNITVFRVERGQSGVIVPLCNCYFKVTLTLQKDDQSVTMASMLSPKNLGSSQYGDRCFNGDYEDIIQ